MELFIGPIVPPRRKNVMCEPGAFVDKDLIKRHITIHDLAKVARKRKVECGFQMGERARINGRLLNWFFFDRFYYTNLCRDRQS